jgi:hypothetical protein
LASGCHRAFEERPLQATGYDAGRARASKHSHGVPIDQDGIALLVGSVLLSLAIDFALSRVAIRGSNSRASLRPESALSAMSASHPCGF